jgi:hypothetical protein
MADQGFPDQHTTTTVTSSNTTVQTNIRYDPLYVRTIPGMLKVAQIVSHLICFHKCKGAKLNLLMLFWHIRKCDCSLMCKMKNNSIQLDE